MVEEMARYESNHLSFVGHIGGDDFIMVTTPEKSFSICQSIICQFDKRLAQFHGESEALAGYYQSINRKGECERFPLLALSIAIISTEIRKYSSYAEISSIASGLKKKAKQQVGSVVIRDQRLLSGADNCPKKPTSPHLSHFQNRPR